MFFTNDMRPQILEEYPGIKFVELGKVLGERWRALTPEQKKKYEEMAANDKVRFQLEMQQYSARKMEAASAGLVNPLHIMGNPAMGNTGYFHDQVTGGITYDAYQPTGQSEHDIKQDPYAVQSSQPYQHAP